jgi:hypothetical protein
VPADRTARGAASEVVKAVLDAISEQGYPRLTDEDAAAAAAAVLRRTARHCPITVHGPRWTRSELLTLANEIDGGTDGE